MRAEAGGVTRRAALGLTVGAVAAAAGATSPVPKAGKDWSPLEALAAKAVADRVVPGLQMSVLDRGRFVYSNGFGLANLETGTAVTTTSSFRAGSITKQFTAAAILLLAEEGKLSPDDRLSRFFPDFPHAGEVSLRQMLSHVSGLGASTIDPAAARDRNRRDVDSASLLATLKGMNPVLVDPPGSKWAYNNFAFRLLGLVVEKASGKPYGEFIRLRLAGPIGLKRTGFDDTGEIVVGRASGYTKSTDAPSGFRNAAFLAMTWPAAAGALRSTTEDLCNWHDALLGGRVLRPSSLEAMLTPVRLGNGALPPHPDDPSRSLEYGFGIRLDSEEGRRLVTHTGSINGFLAVLTSYRAERLTLACLINTDGGGAEAGPAVETRAAVMAEAARIALA